MSRSATSGRVSRARGDDLVATGDLRDDLEVALEPEQRDDRAADERLVLGDEQPDHPSGT